MFSDTHFHLPHTAERGVSIPDILTGLARRNTFFALDIGTHCDDLEKRTAIADSAVKSVPDINLHQHIREMLYFSAGIWPAPEAISERQMQIQELESRFTASCPAPETAGFGTGKLCAVGECGLDHHWNPSGADNRCEKDFSSALLHGEAELFEMQLDLARRLDMPVIVHSRDAFEGTRDCINNVGWHRGIIHCFAYGKAEARAFLDHGWYLSFSGSITYTKPRRIDEMAELLRYVPRDRLLLETDAPYLAPVPYRGQPNTPVLVTEVYRYAAGLLELLPEDLSVVVDSNIRDLFRLPVSGSR